MDLLIVDKNLFFIFTSLSKMRKNLTNILLGHLPNEIKILFIVKLSFVTKSSQYQA